MERGGCGEHRVSGAHRRPHSTAALTEALLETLSSSLLAGGAAPFRERRDDDDTGALRRDFGGLEESSNSSANEKRSLNLHQRGWKN